MECFNFSRFVPDFVLNKLSHAFEYIHYFYQQQILPNCDRASVFLHDISLYISDFYQHQIVTNYHLLLVSLLHNQIFFLQTLLLLGYLISSVLTWKAVSMLLSSFVYVPAELTQEEFEINSLNDSAR